jgi:hypothetical protein
MTDQVDEITRAVQWIFGAAPGAGESTAMRRELETLSPLLREGLWLMSKTLVSARYDYVCAVRERQNAKVAQLRKAYGG